jgi:histidinol-phosphate aminotransferase
VTASLRYEPGPAAPTDLSDNTNLWGPGPAARAALEGAALDGLSRYPSPYGDALKSAAAGYLGVAAAQVVTGCGSDDVLDAAIRAWVRPGERLVFSVPTFSMIPAFAAVNHLEAVPVTFLPNWEVDVGRLVAARGAVTFLCAPNNPTATGVSRAAIEQVVTHAGGLVIIDEAYAEYAGVSAVDLAAASDRVLVTRTLSKAFGLAGVRAGYGICAPELVARIEGARGPYKVTTLSERAAFAALTGDLGWMRARVAETLALRQQFVEAIRDLPRLEVLPSQANFVLVAARDPQSETMRRVDAALRARGVAGRFFPALPRLGDAIRLTIGPWEMLEPAVDALRQEGGG